jgi:hypothetical protein
MHGAIEASENKYITCAIAAEIASLERIYVYDIYPGDISDKSGKVPR